MAYRTICCLLVVLGLLAESSILAQDADQRRAARKARLADYLKRFPDSDRNKDGTLSLAEFRDFRARHRELLEPRRAERSTQRTPPPHSDIPYGEHEKQRFDIWPVPDAEVPTPLVIFIHGGGFRGGDKSAVGPGQPEQFHRAGVAFASLNYRLSDTGPYPIMMHDAARALQTIRRNAARWNVDPKRIACYGGSAGAGISLWLAFHDDLAKPNSDDPIARQSTRILAAGTMNGQSTYDMHTYRQWFGVPDLPVHDALYAFYGIEKDAEIEKASIKELMREASPITHLSKDDDASVYMTFSRPNVEVTKDTSQGAWVHHVLLGLKLKEAMEKLELECHVSAPGAPAENDAYGSLETFLIDKVTQSETGRSESKRNRR